jgi:hypothetical protein
MSTNITDTFKQKLDERAAAEPETPALEMTFAGLLCKVRPLSLEFYVRSGRMPDFLAHVAFNLGNSEAIQSAVEAVSTDDVIAAHRFQRTVVSRVLVEPRVSDGAATPPVADVLDYMELSERAPEFVDAVFSWVLRGCPVPVKGGEGISGETLETFSKNKGRTRRARTRNGGKADGDAPVNAAGG